MHEEREITPQTIPFAHKLQVTIAALVGIWMLLGLWSNIVAHVSMIGDPPPAAITYRIGWPVWSVQSHAQTEGTVSPSPSGDVPLGGVQNGTGSDGGLVLEVACKCEEQLDGSYECYPTIGGIRLPDYQGIVCVIVSVLVVCWLIALLIDVIFKWVCESEWVKKKVSIEQCWEKDCSWWDVVCHASKIWCTIVEVFRWVLQQVCHLRKIFVWGTAIICAVVGVIAVAVLV